MNSTTAISVWALLVITTVIEVLAFYGGLGYVTMVLLVAVVATVNTLLSAMFSMNLREEPTPIKLLIATPVALVFILLISIVFAIGH